MENRFLRRPDAIFEGASYPLPGQCSAGHVGVTVWPGSLRL